MYITINQSACELASTVCTSKFSWEGMVALAWFFASQIRIKWTKNEFTVPKAIKPDIVSPMPSPIAVAAD
jgi:hypothetical protein